MTIDSQDRTATTVMSASPAVQAVPGQNFPVVQRGYDKGRVDRWVHQAVSRMEAMAREIASSAEREAASPQGRQLLADLMQLAVDEIEGKKEAAAQEVAQMLDGAHQQSDGILTDARAQADKIISSATQQASALVASARADAKKTTDEATAHAAAVHEAAGQRVGHFTRLMDDTEARMQQIVDVLGKNLAANKARGTLQEEVDRALAALEGR